MSTQKANLRIVTDVETPVDVLCNAQPIFTDVDLFLSFISNHNEMPEQVRHYARHTQVKMIEHLRNQQNVQP